MKDKIAVIGLGYVGLPLAISLSKFYKVEGFDISQQRINQLKNKLDINKEIDYLELKNSNISYHHIKEILKKNFDVFIVTAPTPVNNKNKPDLSNVINAVKYVAKVYKKKNLVILESTVAPGTTEDICLKIISKTSNIKEKYIQIGFSPERINPGDKNNILKNISKVISGNSYIAIKKSNAIYRKICKKVFIANSIKSAELAKIVENTQRDINISFMNEIMKICEIYNLDYKHVIDICRTKWNFLDFYPGVVGGHCVSVDPYYLIEDLRKKKFKTNIISNARNYNEKFIVYIAEKIIQIINKQKIKKILFYGVSFKDNVLDLRNSKYLQIMDIISKKYKITTYLEKNQKLPKKFDHTYSLDINKYNIFVIGSKNNQTKKIITKIINKRSNPKKIVISLFDKNKYFKKKKLNFFRI